MAEVILGGDRPKKVLEVKIGKKTYNVPLSGSLSIREMKAMRDGTEDGFDFFGRYIPAEVMENMTMDDFQVLNDAWKKASAGQSDVSLGE